MYDLTDKVALVTGAGRAGGIGAAAALRLAQEGAHLVISDLCAPLPPHLANPGTGQWQELQQVAEQIEGLGVRALAVKADVSSAADVKALIEQTLATFGRLDILVNNAGVALGPAPVAQMNETAWRKTLDVNATGVFLCCQAAIPALIQTAKQHGYARIINMSSIAAVRPKPYLAAYAASKAAVIALTQALAQEIAPFGVTVNALLPGDIDTGFKQWGMRLESLVTGRNYEDVVAQTVAQIPVGRIGLPADVADAVAFLASAQSGFINGQAIHLSGGRELTAVIPSPGR
ncbi:MAG: SDR family oxidoreductase [Caldilineales bacterium]|nr:SDR family oxidoreductase [Caldilineales bacterium]